MEQTLYYILHPITIALFYLITGIIYFWINCLLVEDACENVTVNLLIILLWPIWLIFQLLILTKVLFQVLYYKIIIIGTYFAEKRKGKK